MNRSGHLHRRFRGSAAAMLIAGLFAVQFVLLGSSAVAAPDDASATPAAEAPPEAPAEPTGEAPAAPQLSIAVDNGRTATTTGDRLDYAITVQNIGATDVEGLQISQTQPEGLRLESADAGGTEQPGLVLWTVDLAKGQASTLHSTMTVVATPDDLLRLASVACVKVAADAPPIVCAAHSDQLPAGAKAEAEQASMTTAEEPAEPTGMRWFIGGGIAALAVVVVLFIAWWVRSRRRALADEAAAGGPQPDRLVHTGRSEL